MPETSSRLRPHGVQLRLLGGFRCEVGGEPQHLPLACQRVIAFLALHDGPLQRPYVAANLWLDKNENRATANLRSALWRLGKLAEPVVTCDGTSVSLGDEVAIDVRRLADAAYRIADDPFEGEDGASLVPELGLFGHDLLPDWYDDWLVLERERLRQMRLHALDRLSASLLATGRVALAIDAACTSIAGEPLRESAHRALIAAHLVAGNRAEAVRQYERCERILADELGMAPSPQLRVLVGESSGTG